MAQTLSQAQLLINDAVKQREWRRSGKSLKAGVVILLLMAAFGILMVIGGQGDPNDNSAPTCNNQTMRPGDICDTYRNGSRVGSSSYQDRLDEQHNGSSGQVIFGVVVIGGALLLAIPVVRSLNPSAPWGKAITPRCPKCGNQDLREKETSRSVTSGRRKTTYRAIVTLCTPSCGFTTLRPPGTPATTA